MPYGEHRVACLHCGRWYTCGDFITFTCHDCAAAGHMGLPLLGCPVCEREAAERRARIDAAIAARDETNPPERPHPDAP